MVKELLEVMETFHCATAGIGNLSHDYTHIRSIRTLGCFLVPPRAALWEEQRVPQRLHVLGKRSRAIPLRPHPAFEVN